MSHSYSFSDPPLPFPIKVVHSATGPVRIYEIPDDQKAAILKQLYIFSPVPSLDDIMEDIHAGKRFRVRKFLSSLKMAESGFVRLWEKMEIFRILGLDEKEMESALFLTDLCYGMIFFDTCITYVLF